MARLKGAAPRVNKRLKAMPMRAKRIREAPAILPPSEGFFDRSSVPKDCRSRGKGTDEVRHSLHDLGSCSHSGNVRAGSELTDDKKIDGAVHGLEKKSKHDRKGKVDEGAGNAARGKIDS